MTSDEVLAALQDYENELINILSRFREDRAGIHINLEDEPRYRQIGQELIDLLSDQFVDGQGYAKNFLRLLNDSVSNYTGMPSKHGVQTVKSAVASAITRLKRNPNAVHSEATANVVAENASDASSTVRRIAGRLHVIVNQLRRRHGERPTLNVGDEFDLQGPSSFALEIVF